MVTGLVIWLLAWLYVYWFSYVVVGFFIWLLVVYMVTGLVIWLLVWLYVYCFGNIVTG